jgi:hypothetical protein
MTARQLLCLIVTMVTPGGAGCSSTGQNAPAESAGTAAGGSSGAGSGGKGGGAGADVVAPGCNLQEAERVTGALGLSAVGPPETLDVNLPTALTDAQWGPVADACRQGAYDLSSVAGSTACLLGQDITQLCQGYPARVWVVMRDGTVVCVYKTVRAGVNVAPGIYAANDPMCQ